MFQWILQKIAGNYNQKQIDVLLPLVRDANHRFDEYENLKAEDFPKKTEEFKQRYQNGETLDSLLPEAFGLVKQACKKMLGMEIEVKGQKIIWEMVPYDVQLLGGIVLHKGMISEMKTGEGKTLVAAAPVYLNALTGNGVHVVTVNDYLASRDSQWIGYLYQFLGLSVGCVTKGVSLNQRREMYAKDITYVENSELGFDYLRDNLVKSIEARSLTWRPLNYAIVDEIDSILIDEARTPLIISEPHAEATDKYQYYAKIVPMLSPCSNKKKVSKGLLHELLNENKESQEEDGDYYIDEKTKTVALSGQGIKKLEDVLKVNNLYNDIGYEEIHHIENALRAQAVYQKDREYIVNNGEVLIVDEHTGRTMPGRRFSEGLHQAIEAKEGVTIQRESKTLATITYQNFFKQYTKLCGMTGTATTEGEEFEKIYELSVLEIPTHRSTIRVDRNDKVYFNQQAKWKFVREYITFAHEIGQPILIGTSTIDTSEYVSKILEKDGITHYVLNAKFHEQEAHIVSQAGKWRSVVVATNMAGRGTDIKLEKGLNQKLALGYATWIKNNLKKKPEQSISATVYSSFEYDLTIDALKAQFDLIDEQIVLATKDQLVVGEHVLKIRFNGRKKNPTDTHAEILFMTKESGGELLEKDFHYGLFILGTEKHDSRRIDNQLRGRAGRQGDPGVSVFFVALDDLIMKKMGGERIQSMAAMLLPKKELEVLELSQKQFTNSLVRAQKQIEAWNFGIRKHVFDYDNVINKQRQAIYKKRDDILFSEKDAERKTALITHVIEEVEQYIPILLEKQIFTAQQLGQSVGEFLTVFQKEFSLKFDSAIIDKIIGYSYQELQQFLSSYLVENFHDRVSNVENEQLYHVIKDVYLYHIDTLWMKHIDDMEYLRDKVGLMGYAQIDPLIVYKKEAFDKFTHLLSRLKTDITSYFVSFDFRQLNVAVQKEVSSEKDYEQLLQKVSANLKDYVHQKPVKKSSKMVYQDAEDVEVFEVGGDDAAKGPSQAASKGAQGASNYDAIFDTSSENSSENSKKIRPNDMCPCGSGKKYKKCCGA